MKRVGVIDIGSNTIKLLIASGTNEIKTEHISIEESRISTGISKNVPVLLPESIKRATRAVLNLVTTAKKWDLDELKIVATSAVRDAQNGSDFAQSIYEKCNHKVHILSGEEEAEAIAYGLKFDPSIQGKKNYFHFDLGGGSLEFNQIEDGKLIRAISMPLGAVRLMERFIQDPNMPMLRNERTKIEKHVIETLINEKVIVASENTELIFTGGSATISRTLMCKKSISDFAQDDAFLSKNKLEDLYLRLSTINLKERLLFEFLPSNRADVVCPAIIILSTLLSHCEKHGFHHSLYSLRHGISAKMLNL